MIMKWTGILDAHTNCLPASRSLDALPHTRYCVGMYGYDWKIVIQPKDIQVSSKRVLGTSYSVCTLQ